MPDLLLELFSEEIPARMQARAAEDLRKLVTDRLVDAGLVYEGAKAFATPRRLALTVQGVPARQPDVKEEKKGPRVGAPERAIAGFLKRAGLASIAEAKVQPDKKGDFYVAVIEKPGRPAIDVIAEILPEVVRALPVAEVDALGQLGRRARPGCGRCIRSSPPSGRRPRSPTIVPFAVDGITAGNDDPRPSLSWRRSRSRCAASTITRHKLEKAKVVLDPSGARRSSSPTPRTSPSRRATNWSRTQALLDEVAGLVEWPVVLMGSFDEAFLAIPPEVIRTTIRTNQKCFVLRDPRTAQARQQVHSRRQHRGRGRRQGDRRRQRARHPRAAVGCEVLLRDRSEDDGSKTGCRSSSTIVFHEKLGTQAERIARIEALAGRPRASRSAPMSHKAERAAQTLQGRSAHRSGRRVSRAAGPDGQVLRRGAGRGRGGRARLRGSLQAARARTISCRPIRSRSRSRSPTRSTRWSASGRSTRSRPARRTRMRCDGQRWE